MGRKKIRKENRPPDDVIRLCYHNWKEKGNIDVAMEMAFERADKKIKNPTKLDILLEMGAGYIQREEKLAKGIDYLERLQIMNGAISTLRHYGHIRQARLLQLQLTFMIEDISQDEEDGFANHLLGYFEKLNEKKRILNGVENDRNKSAQENKGNIETPA